MVDRISLQTTNTAQNIKKDTTETKPKNDIPIVSDNNDNQQEYLGRRITYEEMRELVAEKLKEFQNLEKPEMGLKENKIEKEVDFDEMDKNPTEDSYYMERGVKIIYKGGVYLAPDCAEVGQNKSLMALTYAIGPHLKQKNIDDLSNKMETATNNIEKRVAIDEFIEAEKERNTMLGKDYIRDNEIPVGSKHRFMIKGKVFEYKIGENYEVIFNNASIYAQYGCLND